MLTFESVLCFLDDVCIASETFSEHMKKLHEVLSRFESAGLKLGPGKPSNFFKVVTRKPNISTVSTSCQTKFVQIDNNEPMLTETLADSKMLITNENHKPVIAETLDNSIKSTESLNNQNEPFLTENPNSVKSKDHDQCKQDVEFLAQNRPKRQVCTPVRYCDYVTDEQNSYS